MAKGGLKKLLLFTEETKAKTLFFVVSKLTWKISGGLSKTLLARVLELEFI